jgi:hypothetical protein
MLTEDIRKAMKTASAEWSPASPAQTGFYALYLKEGIRLPAIEAPEDGLLYIGMTKKGFAARDHFYPYNSSSGSTLRRSLGAILKANLGLNALPRDQSGHWRSYYNYRFTIEGEATPSEWMFRSLNLARIPFDGNIPAAENKLIASLMPPLNLTGWPNGQRPAILELRRACAMEAKLALENSAA